MGQAQGHDRHDFGQWRTGSPPPPFLLSYLYIQTWHEHLDIQTFLGHTLFDFCMEFIFILRHGHAVGWCDSGWWNDDSNIGLTCADGR